MATAIRTMNVMVIEAGVGEEVGEIVETSPRLSPTWEEVEEAEVGEAEVGEAEVGEVVGEVVGKVVGKVVGEGGTH